MDDSPVPASELPPVARTLAELLLERVELAKGRCRLELVAEDGRLTYVVRHEKIGAKGLDRFDRDSRETATRPES